MLVLAVFLLLYLSGCSNCGIQKDKSFDYREIKKTAPWYSQESYSYQEKQVEKECRTVEPESKEEETSDEKEVIYGKYKLKLGPVEWVDQPPVLGKTNWIRRKMTVYNGYDELKMIYLDKLEYYDGKLLRSSKNPMKVMVDPMSSREVPLMKDLQYDPRRDIGADFSNRTLENLPEPLVVVEEEGPKEICEEKTVMVDKTGYRNISKGTRDVVQGYREILKVRLSKEC
ncbi:TPA: hypothetical protein HA265_01625 [Candidatus Woesearchaeota archaeon]|nr:hypothetical protein [Candidatus Woesearchaeota archaeon]